MKNNNAWNIRRLVDESFVPATQRIILKIVGFYIVSGYSTWDVQLWSLMKTMDLDAFCQASI